MVDLLCERVRHVLKFTMLARPTSAHGSGDEELSLRINNFLSQVENGRKGVSLPVVERIAEDLDIPVTLLILLYRFCL
jgi:transcriptional regulator with XRE-family HTH domain